MREMQRRTQGRARLYAKRYYAEHRDYFRDWLRQYAFNNREAYNAQRVLGHAVKVGKIARQPCEVCGNPRTDGHHDDYSRPLDVRWMCRMHHRELHTKLAEVARA